MPWIIQNPVQYVGKAPKSSPNHGVTCVALPQQLANMPETSRWRRGIPVRNATLQPGTVIAIFDKDGNYTNDSGSAHVALYVGQTDEGIEVVHQNQTPGFITGSFIPFGGGAPKKKPDVKGSFEVSKSKSGTVLRWLNRLGDHFHHWGVSKSLHKPEDDAANYYVVEPKP